MNRRHFISQAATLVAAGAVIPTVPAVPVSGMNYSPAGVFRPVVKPGEFPIAAVHLDHGHIIAMCNGLVEAGATVKWVFDPDPEKVRAFRQKFPSAKEARSLDEILGDAEIRLVAAAAVTSLRGPLGCRVVEGGKDYFTDKAPVTSFEQLVQAKEAVARTGRKFMVYYGERLHNESAMYALDLIRQGAVGRVIQVTSLAPHRLSKASRPAWFFERAKYGGVLCDIGSHQFEQFLAYSGAQDANVIQAAVGNFANPDYPEFEDYGEASLVADNGTSNFIRVDWLTPDGLSNWGDGRTFILGTKGFIELRKYLDLARDKTGNHVFIADGQGERQIDVSGKVGYRFFGELILDCLNRTELAMTQAHAFKAAELALKAQAAARRLTG